VIDLTEAFVLLQALFSSRVRVRLLTIFLLNPDVRLHASALTQSVGAQYNAVWKELNNLERAGVLVSAPSANTKVYSVNSRCPILPQLRGIILKTVGIGDTLRQALTNLGSVDAAFIYGSFASDEADSQSDIDVMIIGKVDLTRLAPIVARLEKDLGRAVNYIAYAPDEWREKQREPFIVNVLSSPKIMLIGDEDALRSTGATRTHQALQGKPRRNSQVAKGRRARPRRRRTQPA
jgi:predicted nucleotidyltransferase